MTYSHDKKSTSHCEASNTPMQKSEHGRAYDEGGPQRVIGGQTSPVIQSRREKIGYPTADGF